MALGLHTLFEPEETVGSLWHDIVTDLARPDHPEAAVSFAAIQRSAAFLFRALGGAPAVEVVMAPPDAGLTPPALASFDGTHLRLPPEIALFDRASLNRRAYLWLVAQAVLDPVDISRICPGLAELATPGAIRLHRSDTGPGPAAPDTGEAAPPPSATPAIAGRKRGLRRDLDQANRRDSFIVHRFEAILSWVENLNLNRSVDDNDQENAQKAADDQDLIGLTRHDRRAATRLRLHLDLSPAEADHERLSDRFTYPEWNHRGATYMPDHTQVLEAEVTPDPAGFTPDPRHLRAVRRQFEALRPRRILSPRQLDGAELDLDAVVAAQVETRATGRGSDRIHLASRQIERDLATAFLVDCSRSTEAAVGDASVIYVARQTLAALAGGIDSLGDRFGIWGFSSLRRNRVFLHRCKGFDEPMTPVVRDRIGALKPGHYTRLGAAIRHVAAQLVHEPATRKLLVVLTDGKPNDLDHYEGQHGIEDSRMAVREARRAGLALHAVVIDEDGQTWFARIFGERGFSLLPSPARLTIALPDLYRTLTEGP
jgi:nitric oxide reductase NorD protein